MLGAVRVAGPGHPTPSGSRRAHRSASFAFSFAPRWSQTLSGQIGALEASLGATLFHRRGRGLVLTETGQMVLDYAEEIFRVGSELEEALKSRAAGRAIPFRVGIADVVPKAIASVLLAPSMNLPEAGLWEMEVTIKRGERAASVFGRMPVASPRLLLLSYWRSLSLPWVIVILFAMNQWLKRRAASRGSASVGLLHSPV